MTRKDEFSFLQYDEQEAHLAHLEITRQWIAMTLPYAVICILMFGVSLLTWLLELNFAIGVFTSFVALIMLILIRVSIRSLHYSRSNINRQFAQWEQNQETLREIATQKAQADITIARGGQAVIHQGSGQSQVLMLSGDSKDLERFIKHRREFVARVKLARQNDPSGKATGTERNYWLHANLDRSAYQWSDGTRVGTPEYEYLMESLEDTSLEPLERRKGTRGKPQTTPLLVGDDE